MEEKEEDRVIIVAGNPIDGFEFFGPFGCETDAIDWADAAFDDREWWTGYVNNPKE